MPFEKLALSTKTLQAIQEVGYTTPTPIQEIAVPILLKKHDLIALAQTGSGKTASFVWPLLDRLSRGRAKARMPRSIIMEPTRELAAQVAEDFHTYGKHHSLTTAVLIGGESFADQEKKLSKGVDVLIATPGRLLDLYDRGKILLNDVKVLIIDEADRMLDMGFIPDIERIASLLPAHQTALFSATMPPPIRNLTQKFLKNPEEITISAPKESTTHIEQYILKALEKDKLSVLYSLIKQQSLKQAIVFCNRKREVDAVERYLKNKKLKVGALHGDMSQTTRVETLKAFKDGSLDLLIASDIAARGLDIEALPLVINFHVPSNPEDYIHRIGRTGRAGKEGKAFTLVSPHEEKALKLIHNTQKQPIEEFVLQTVGEVTSRESTKPKKAPSLRETPVPEKVVGFGDHVPLFMSGKVAPK